MNLLNVEIKARCNQPDKIRDKLANINADYKGTDHQVDTYFDVPTGRLKLREGHIEHNLIYYRRPDQAAPKASEIMLHPVNNARSLKEILTDVHGVLTVVDKEREIYFVKNVKFHIDRVQQLGSFVEIEAIRDDDDATDEEKLREQCAYYMDLLEIHDDDLVDSSYSDMMLNLEE